MRIDRNSTDDTVLSELGARLARARLERNLTQEQLAEQAGISRVTLARLETGQNSRTPTLIRVLRALDLLDALDRLIAEPAPSPIERLKLEGARRQRGSGRRGVQPRKPRGGPWRWGDEER